MPLRQGCNRLLGAAGCALVLLSALARADDSDTSPVRLSVGPAAYSLPRFPGSDRSRTIYFPFIDAEYDNRLYMSASDLIGVYAYKTDLTQTGVALQWDPMRRLTQDDLHLRGLTNVKDSARAKFFASRTFYFVTLEENLATDVLGRGQGTVSQTNIWLTAPLTPTLALNLGPGFTWTDHTYMRSFYTVPEAAAAQNPLLTPYMAHAGVSDLHLNGLAEWTLRSHYRLGVLAYVAHLHGEAAGSPLALQRSQRMIMAWLAYKFW